MLKTTEVDFENLGYCIPKYIDNNGKLKIKKGTKIIVNIEDLLPNSNVTIEYICDYCGKVSQKYYCDFFKSINYESRQFINKDCCINCIGKRKSEIIRFKEEKEKYNETKICSTCKREFPKTLEYFNNDKYRPDGLTTNCKECRYKKIIFGLPKKEVISDGYKKCIDCNNIISINSYKTNKQSKDGYYNVCTECFIKRKRKGCREGYKKCKKCGRELPVTRDFFAESSRCLDGFINICLECYGRNFYPNKASEPWSDEDKKIIKDNYLIKTIKEIQGMLSVLRTPKAILHMSKKLNLKKVDNYEPINVEDKYKMIDNKLHKICKNCRRYLPLDIYYYPKDNGCVDDFRNICKECKGENFGISNKHKWNDLEDEIIINNYSNMTNNELINKYFPNLSLKQITDRSQKFNLHKSKETMIRVYNEITQNEEKNKAYSNYLKSINMWKGEDNPQYGSNRIGELNPNYKGGISALHQELRRNLGQWKFDSMENCDYKCIFTGNYFDNIHHLYSFNLIVRDTLNELDFPLCGNISFYTQNDLNIIINKCLEIHYRYPLGVCLQRNIHILFHSIYGYYNNTIEQFEEFAERYYNNDFANKLIV